MIEKEILLTKIADGETSAYLGELVEDLKPKEEMAVYQEFAELIADWHREGVVESYDLTAPMSGIRLPINIALKQ